MFPSVWASSENRENRKVKPQFSITNPEGTGLCLVRSLCTIWVLIWPMTTWAIVTNRHLGNSRGKGFALEKMCDFPKISLAAKRRFSWLIFKRGFQNLRQEIWEQSSLYKLSVQTVTSQFFSQYCVNPTSWCFKPNLLGIAQCSCFILSKTICRKFPGEERCTFYLSFLIPFSVGTSVVSWYGRGQEGLFAPQMRQEGYGGEF